MSPVLCFQCKAQCSAEDAVVGMGLDGISAFAPWFAVFLGACVGFVQSSSSTGAVTWDLNCLPHFAVP